MPTIPDVDALADLPVHVVVRDFPETLAVFRREGVDVAALGGESVRAAAAGRESAGGLIESLMAALAWRAAPGRTDDQAPR
ncbi:MAG TPA: hypothetical protein VNZ57_10485 [Longimicrobiales bacterium]|nr:hypothetical protein [Longimicrobiales bacterium]